MVLNGFIASRPKGSEPHGHFDAPTVTDCGLRQTFGGAAEYAPEKSSRPLRSFYERLKGLWLIRS